MVRLVDMPAVGRGFIARLGMPERRSQPWTRPVDASRRRVAVVSTAAVSRRGEKPFTWHARDYRSFLKDERDLVMTHVAVEYDRTAWQQDMNAIIPLDRLIEMADAGEIESVAEEHFAFLGSSDPKQMQRSAMDVAERLRTDGVNTVFLIPV
ncbi:MAG: glycine/sarcosine/betaine reductase selenoprotein B family protein [Pseudomonadota bacterium]